MTSPQQQQTTPDQHEVAIRTTNLTGQENHTSSSNSSSTAADDARVSSRFQHVVTKEGHAIATSYDRTQLLRCEDEPIHIPGAIQSFGLLIAFERQQGHLIRIVSENSEEIIGYPPDQLFALNSFTDLLPENQHESFLEHLDFVQEDGNIASNGPEVFSLSICTPTNPELRTWCAMHVNAENPNLFICELELENDRKNPLVPSGGDLHPEQVSSTLDGEPAEDDWQASTQSTSKPLRMSRGKQPSHTQAGMEVSRVILQVQEQLGSASTLQNLLDVLVGLVKDLTSFHRTMVYQFDRMWNGRVVAELLDPRTTRDLYRGLNFPATDIPKQARELYKVNKVRLLYDREQETARLVCRTTEDLTHPLDLTHSYLRAMSPIHSQYLRNMDVRSSLSISITAFGDLWGLVSCHAYGSRGLRISFLSRTICRIIGDTASRNVERISYTSRLQMRSLINTVPTKQNPSGYITASSDNLIKLFQASVGFLTIRDETKMLGKVVDAETSLEVVAVLQYLRNKCITKVTTSTDIEKDFADLQYPPGFRFVAGLLLVPLSSKGQDFIVFFRKSQTQEVKWAGNPNLKQAEGHLMPRTSFKSWSQTVSGSKDWTEEELEAASVLCLVYGKFIDVWRQKEAALQNSQITRVLLANSAHEVRTPLNAIINYLEIALEGDLDGETRENLTVSYSASRSLIYVINDMLDLTATVEGGDLTQNETFDIRNILKQVTDWFSRDARRKRIYLEVNMHEDTPLPVEVVGDARRLRQSVSNIIANAIENTTTGGIRVDVATTSLHDMGVTIEISVSDTGVGMDSQKVNALYTEISQLGSGQERAQDDITDTAHSILAARANAGEERILGLGLAVVARVVQNMHGQFRVSSEEGKGSRFVLVIPFGLPKPSPDQQTAKPELSVATADPSGDRSDGLLLSETPTPPIPEKEMVLVEFSDRSIFRAPQPIAETSATRLIAEIQKPSEVEGWSGPGNTDQATSAICDQEHDHKGPDIVPDTTLHPASESRQDGHRTGTVKLEGQGQPLRASHIHSELDIVPHGTLPNCTSVDGEVGDIPNTADRPLLLPPGVLQTLHEPGDDPKNIDRPHSSEKMHVLVAEDNPLNSRILEKRLKKRGHEVHLTNNGEECAFAYREGKGRFDIILMDIQMPIMNGFASTEAIRSFEKSSSHPSGTVSRSHTSSLKTVPIIVVSASLSERELEYYTKVGFDGWIMKPISFDRLEHIMTGVAELDRRREDLYKPGRWEQGGWFKEVQDDLQCLEDGGED